MRGVGLVLRGGRGGRAVVGGVVEVRLVMRRGGGMRWRDGVVGVEVVVGWREEAERLWEMEGRMAMGWFS